MPVLPPAAMPTVPQQNGPNALERGLGLLAGSSNFSPLFNISMGLLAAGGPSATPKSTLQRLAEGVMAGQQMTQGQQSLIDQRQQRAFANEIARRKLEAAAAERDRRAKAGQSVAALLKEFGPKQELPQPGMGQPSTPPGVLSGEQAATLSALGALDPEAALSTLSGMLNRPPSALAQKIQTLETQLRRPLTEKEILNAASAGGTTVNVGAGPLDKPIPLSQLPNVRLPDGSTPKPGTTLRQAQDAGATVTTPQAEEAGNRFDTALSVIDELEALGLGDDGVFSKIEPGIQNRGEAALGLWWDRLTQEDPRASQFNDLADGTLSAIIRNLGEKGSLSDNDQKRARALIPQVYPVPDTAEVARKKLADLRKLLNTAAGRGNKADPAGRLRTDTAPPLQGGPKRIPFSQLPD